MVVHDCYYGNGQSTVLLDKTYRRQIRGRRPLWLLLLLLASSPGSVWSGICVPATQCSRHTDWKPIECKLSDGSYGFICHTSASRHLNLSGRWPMPKRFERYTLPVEAPMMENAAKQNSKCFNELTKTTRGIELNEHNFGALPVTNNSERFPNQTTSRDFSYEKTVCQLKILSNSYKIRSLNHTRKRRRVRRSSDLDLIPDCDPLPMPHCQEIEADYWRNDIGQCNHLHVNTRAGAAWTAQARLMAPRYQDHVWEPLQTGFFGTPLPSPRAVSVGTIDTSPSKAHALTAFFLVMGQLVAHDLVLSTTRPPTGLTSCCSQNQLPKPPLHEDCRPIPVAGNDPLYQQAGVRCLNQFRSNVAKFELSGCLPRAASPANQVTHFLDGSIIYGSSSSQVGELRAKRGGKLKMDINNMLVTKRGRFLTGESRSNVTPMLSFLHTLLAREHNRIASVLQNLRPDLSDQDLFMLARRVFVAEYQHIVYNEFLPIILGFDYIDEYALNVNSENLYQFQFDSNVDPHVSVEFSTAAFRFGHSMIMNDIELRDRAGQLVDSEKLTNLFFDEDILNDPSVFEMTGRGLLMQSPRAVDRSYSPAAVEQLFATSSENLGLDLVALNLNRGRDHGLPSYVQMLERCSNTEVKSWRDIAHLFYQYDLNNLMDVYQSVHDIELYIGGVLELPAEGALVGPTFQCIIGEQFFATLYGDRFFYLHQNTLARFSDREIDEIRKASMSRLLCDNLRELNWIPPLAFWQRHEINPLQSCRSEAIPRIDLSVFLQYIE